MDSQAAIDELRRSEGLYRSVVENLPMCVARTDRQGRFTFVNGHFCAVLNRAPGELLGRTYDELGPAELMDAAARNDARVLASGQPLVTIEERQLAGQTRLLHVVRTPIHDAAGQCCEVQTIGIDVTDRVQAERASQQTLEEQVAQRTRTLEAIAAELRRAMQQTRLILDAAGDAFVGLDGEGRIVDWNPAAEATFGWPMREALGQLFVETVLAPANRDVVRDALRQLVASGSGMLRDRHVDLVALHRTGREFPVELSVTHSQLGGIHFVNAFLHDISERKRAEKAVQDSQAVYASLVENIPLNVLRKDLEGRFVFANRAFCARQGISLRELIGRTDLDLYPRELAEKYRRDDRRIIETGETYEDIEAHEDAGQTVWVQVVKTPVRDAHGAIVGTQAIFWDVTGRRRAEEELRRYAAELEASNRELEQFTTVVSHDLHAPLRAAATYCEMLDAEYAARLEAPAQEYISLARQSLARMHTLIEDLRSLTRVTTRGKQLQPVSSQDVLDGALINLGAEIKRSAAHVTHDRLPLVLADATQLLQVFQNLIGNAIKYTREQPPRIHISAVADGDRWRFGVRDNGIGIAPKDVGRLFVIFQRLHSDEDEYAGTGVGLALCKRIVERHGGRIWVESQPGAGSTFYFTLSRA